VWGPDAVALGNRIYLFYSSLGWETLPEQIRDGKGSLGSLGECHRAGLDFQWGKKKVSYKEVIDKIYAYDLILTEDQFFYALDNDQGVLLAPRIGLVTSTINRLRLDPTDWDEPELAFDVGKRCAGFIEIPIDLGDIGMPGLIPDINWDGAYSPDVKVTKAVDGESNLFLMFYTGLTAAEAPGDMKLSQSNIGLARSMDLKHWEFVRAVDPLLTYYDFDVFGIFGGTKQYTNPSVVFAGDDEYGEPMYGMFFNQFESRIGKTENNGVRYGRAGNYDLRIMDNIGYALRKGKSTGLVCSVQDSYWTGRHERIRSILQIVIIAIPLLLALAVRLSGRVRA